MSLTLFWYLSVDFDLFHTLVIMHISYISNILHTDAYVLTLNNEMLTVKTFKKVLVTFWESGPVG